ncbi:MAG: hypothetical protein ICV78_12390 [Tolypothrix sp. Co-bin9]|nr:hypothetical protein [Tolypothrix sp. Co-bin9]
MGSQTYSIRLNDAETKLLEAFQTSEDKTLNQTVARLVREAIGANNMVNSANNLVNTVNIEELVREEVDQRMAYLATAMNEVKAQLENDIKFLKTELQNLKQDLETRSHIPVTTETTEESVVFSQPPEQEQVKENAIAPETTEEEVVSGKAGKKLSKNELRTEANTIYMRLKRNGLKISATIIKEKILELYPNSEDWLSDDARLDVIRALEKQHK